MKILIKNCRGNGKDQNNVKVFVGEQNNTH